MIRELLAGSLYGWIGTISLLLFFTAFVAITLRTMFASKKKMDDQADIPLSDGERSDDDDRN
ncbi:hypothetical protein GC197_00310 [bacterium]|nr:hypothetical protein [bacterium]